MISSTLGGIGIFLIGMILLTEGLKDAAGSALRDVLQRFTRGPGSAMASGAAVTALVQSSSATTLTTIGFVSAGLLTFPQAVGVIFGANVGTTSTGWIVALLGLKIQIAAIAFPLVGVGALLRLLGHGRKADIGMALAGFGLIFVGIDVLQVGMTGLSERFDPASFPGSTLGGRVALVVIGLAMTVVMQSSSAAVATTLTALHSGAIGFEQAGLLVVGQNVGTTVTAALATIGASVPARRTAMAHILFNLITAAIALLVFPVLMPLTLGVAGEGDPATAIALFHTTFNLLGVALLFPVLPAFSRLVERMVKEDTPSLTRHLDRTVGAIPTVAVEAARQATIATALRLFTRLAETVRPRRVGGVEKRMIDSGPDEEAGEALSEIRRFMGTVRSPNEAAPEFERHLSVLHALDHLDRIRSALDSADGAPLPWVEGPLAETAAALAALLDSDEDGLVDQPHPSAEEFAHVSHRLADLRKARRSEVLKRTAEGKVSPEDAQKEIEWAKRLDRLAYHVWRSVHHLERASTLVPTSPEQPPVGISAEGMAREPEGEVFEDSEVEHPG